MIPGVEDMDSLADQPAVTFSAALQSTGTELTITQVVKDDEDHCFSVTIDSYQYWLLSSDMATKCKIVIHRMRHRSGKIHRRTEFKHSIKLSKPHNLNDIKREMITDD